MSGSQALAQGTNLSWSNRNIFFDDTRRQRLQWKGWLKLCCTLVLMQCNLVKEKIRDVLTKAKGSLNQSQPHS